MALTRGEKRINAAGVATGGRVILTGGGAKSIAYRQILADLTQRPVLIADPEDASEAPARGAAIQAAAIAQGRKVTSVRDEWAPHFDCAAQPRMELRHAYETASERYACVADWAAFDGKLTR